MSSRLSDLLYASFRPGSCVHWFDFTIRKQFIRTIPPLQQLYSLVCLFVIPSVLAIANFSLLSGVLTVSVFSWHFHTSIFAIPLLMLFRLFYCCFLNFFSYKNRRSEFGIRLTRTRTTVIGRNSPKVMTWFRYIFIRKSITHFAYRSPPRRWCIPLTRM